jgi:hypothetical protein
VAAVLRVTCLVIERLPHVFHGDASLPSISMLLQTFVHCCNSMR